MSRDKYGVDEVQFLRSHRPLARRLTELEAENESLRQQVAAFAPPDGYVLVPADSVKHCACGCERYCCTHCGTELGGLAARPEAP